MPYHLKCVVYAILLKRLKLTVLKLNIVDWRERERERSSSRRRDGATGRQKPKLAEQFSFEVTKKKKGWFKTTIELTTAAAR